MRRPCQASRVVHAVSTAWWRPEKTPARTPSGPEGAAPPVPGLGELSSRQIKRRVRLRPGRLATPVFFALTSRQVLQVRLAFVHIFPPGSVTRRAPANRHVVARMA